jgi:hypothetical protein
MLTICQSTIGGSRRSAPIDTDRPVGVANPYTLVELCLGANVPWDDLDDPVGLMETVLGSDRTVLFAGRPESPLYIRRACDLDAWRRLAGHPPGDVSRQRLDAALERLFSVGTAADLRPRDVQAASHGWSGGRPLRWGDSGTFDGDGVDATDPIQGCLGDCYLIGAMVAVAFADPALLRLRPLSPGGTRVEALFSVSHHTSDERIVVRDDVPLVPNTKTPLYGRSVKRGESWPAVLEKAYASWRGGGGNRPDYFAISGGDCLEAMRGLTGRRGGERRPASGSLAWLKALCPRGRASTPIMTWTYPSGGYSGTNVLAGHAYAVFGVSGDSRGREHIILRNPFGRRDQTDGQLAPPAVLNTRWKKVYNEDQGVIVLPATAFQDLFHGVAALVPGSDWN